MDHITQYHIYSQVDKSTFTASENAQQLIQEMLSHPTLIKPHETKPGRWWYMKYFGRVIGYRGIDQAECYWGIVLLDQSQLITAYPIPHPWTLHFMR